MSDSIHPDAVYSREQAAQLLGVSLATLKRLIAARQLEASRIAGRRILIRGSSIIQARTKIWR
jgi:excisionase family DNA binding protein